MMRGSSNQQDTSQACDEMAVRDRPPRSTLKALAVRPVASEAIRSLIVREHYLHSMPAAPRYCFGVYVGDGLHGAAVFTAGARLGHHVVTGRPQDVVTLARLWLSDALPPNSESRVLGYLVRWLRRQTTHKAILSYADPLVGHVGTIYQAVGWLYLGQTDGDAALDVGDGTVVHRRTAYDRFGTNAVSLLRRTGLPRARWVHRPGKHRYLCLLDPAWRWRVKLTPQEYPCRPP
jgi:hypothetical protein